jgi:hypothetical protein
MVRQLFALADPCQCPIPVVDDQEVLDALADAQPLIEPPQDPLELAPGNPAEADAVMTINNATATAPVAAATPSTLFAPTPRPAFLTPRPRIRFLGQTRRPPLKSGPRERVGYGAMVDSLLR